MNKYRVIIIDNQGRELFNKVYEIPIQVSVINNLTENPDFLDDLQGSAISINDPSLKWDIYLESPLEFEQDKLVKEIQQELIYNNFNTERLNNTIHQLLEDIGIHYTYPQVMPKDLKEYLINHISANL